MLKEVWSVLTVDQVMVFDLVKSSTAPWAGEVTCRAATDAASARRPAVIENCIVEEFRNECMCLEAKSKATRKRS